MPSGEDSGKRPSPPYVSFPSLKTMVGGFKLNGLPARIDRSVLGNFSGAVGGQLLTALKFLKLAGDEGAPRPALEGLIAAHGTDVWPAALADALKSAYSPLFEMNLQTASPAQFNERFREAYPMEGETFRKCLTFFLHAVKDAQIPISAYITKNKKPRATNGPRKPRTTKGNTENVNPEVKANTSDQSKNDKPDESKNPSQGDDFRDQLLQKFPTFEPSWSEDLKSSWFKGFEQFMALAKK